MISLLKSSYKVTMETEREEIIRKWFAMWLSKEDGGILELFSPTAVYIESWGRNITEAKRSGIGFGNGINAAMS